MTTTLRRSWMPRKKIINPTYNHGGYKTNHQEKMKFSHKDFFSKCDQILSFPCIWSHLLKKSLVENFIFLCSATANKICHCRQRPDCPLNENCRFECLVCNIAVVIYLFIYWLKHYKYARLCNLQNTKAYLQGQLSYRTIYMYLYIPKTR